MGGRLTVAASLSAAELVATVGVVVGIVSGVVALASRWNRAAAGRIDTRTRHIIEQMRPNDGSTLRDRIDRIEVMVELWLERDGVTAAEILERLRQRRSKP